MKALALIGVFVVFGFCAFAIWAAVEISGRGNDSDA